MKNKMIRHETLSEPFSQHAEPAVEGKDYFAISEQQFVEERLLEQALNTADFQRKDARRGKNISLGTSALLLVSNALALRDGSMDAQDVAQPLMLLVVSVWGYSRYKKQKQYEAETQDAKDALDRFRSDNAINIDIEHFEID